MEMKPINPQEFFSTVLEMVKPQMDEKSIQCQLQTENVPVIQGDTQQLQRVFMNLLSNAIKYTPESGTIYIRLEQNNEVIQAEVSDTGCGISEEELPKLFQEFFRSADPINSTIRGTGLGLSLVKRIVEAHHGKIWVTSKKGIGSTFYINLPTSPKAQAHAP
jgi:two-component system phosphate regulon sensor histidine kinase PhoR